VSIDGYSVNIAGMDGDSSCSGFELEVNVTADLEVTMKTALGGRAQVATSQQ
jgi:hypothetical protein